MSDLMWVEATRQLGEEQSLARLTAARIEVLPLWPFLAAAESEADYANRKALAFDRIANAVVATVGSEDYALMHELEASLDADWKLLHEARRAQAEGGQTCAQCGAPIERDPAGEEPRTWHHADGDKHDHEARPAGDAKESRLVVGADEKCPGCGGPITFGEADKDGITIPFYCPNPDCKAGKHPKESKTAGRYCKTHQVWIGSGNADNHDEACKIEERATEASRATPPHSFLDDKQPGPAWDGSRGPESDHHASMDGADAHRGPRAECAMCAKASREGGAAPFAAEGAVNGCQWPGCDRTDTEKVPYGDDGGYKLGCPEHREMLRKQGSRATAGARIDKFRRIVDERTMGDVDGQPVDLFSASAVVQVHDALSPENQARFEAMSPLAMAEAAFKVVNNASGRSASDSSSGSKEAAQDARLQPPGSGALSVVKSFLSAGMRKGAPLAGTAAGVDNFGDKKAKPFGSDDDEDDDDEHKEATRTAGVYNDIRWQWVSDHHGPMGWFTDADKDRFEGTPEFSDGHWREVGPEERDQASARHAEDARAQAALQATAVLFASPEEHAANPPSTWQVVKQGDRRWSLQTQGGDELQAFTTKEMAERHKSSGFYFDLYERESRWYAGGGIPGWKPYQAGQRTADVADTVITPLGPQPGPGWESFCKTHGVWIDSSNAHAHGINEAGDLVCDIELRKRSSKTAERQTNVAWVTAPGDDAFRDRVVKQVLDAGGHVSSSRWGGSWLFEVAANDTTSMAALERAIGMDLNRTDPPYVGHRSSGAKTAGAPPWLNKGDGDKGGDKPAAKPEQDAGGDDPTSMQPGQQVTINYTLATGESGTLPGTFQSGDGTQFFFDCETGKFAVTQQGSEWVDSQGTKFTFAAQEAEQPAEKKPFPPAQSSLVAEAGFPLCAKGCGWTLSALAALVNTEAGMAHAECPPPGISAVQTLPDGTQVHGAVVRGADGSLVFTSNTYTDANNPYSTGGPDVTRAPMKPDDAVNQGPSVQDAPLTTAPMTTRPRQQPGVGEDTGEPTLVADDPGIPTGDEQAGGGAQAPLRGMR